MSRYQARNEYDSDDDMRGGPYYSEGRFYRSGSRPSRSSYDDESRGFSHRAYSPLLSPRPSHSSYDDDPRRRARTPTSPPRARGYSSTPGSSYSSTHRASSPPPHPSYFSESYSSQSSYARSPPRSSYSSGPPPRPSHSSSDYSSRPSSGYSRPPPQAQSSSSTPPPRPNSPVPYTYDDEELDSIPQAPAKWNNFTSSSTREQLVTFFIGRGFSSAIVEREVGKEFEAHAPQHRSGQAAPGPSRAQEAAQGSRTENGYGGGGPRPSHARSPSPEKFSRYRESARDRSESPDPVPNYGSYAGWRQQDYGPSGGFRDPPSFRDPPRRR
ncbi:hypothetical protein N431DRAFT_447265 [Stipitochalara longipes BDJ]|nr:hypothetical protein N431DRAFT_447265 [Stipitochalara longipes BDJ]